MSKQDGPTDIKKLLHIIIIIYIYTSQLGIICTHRIRGKEDHSFIGL